MRILYDHQVFSLQDAGGASRYHFELIRNLQASAGVALELLIGLNNSVMPFATLRQPNTRVFGRATRIKPGLTRYALNELFSAVTRAAPGNGGYLPPHALPSSSLGASPAHRGHPPRLHP